MSSLAKKDEVELTHLEGSLTVQDGIQGIQLRKMEEKMGKKAIIKAISYLLLRLSENFNVGKNFNTSQAVVAASDLFDIFGYESMEDVVLMFKYARQGKVGGKIYNLDHQAIFHQWVPDYLEIKAQERERVHKEKKSNENNVLNFKWDKNDVDKLEVSPVKMNARDRMDLIHEKAKKKEKDVDLQIAKKGIDEAIKKHAAQ